MKREREEEVGGAAMSPSLGLPSAGGGASAAARVLLLGRAMEAPSGIHSLRAPSPFVRAMRTRVDPPPPPPPLAAAPTPPLPLPLPPPPPQLQIPEKRRRGRPRNCDRLLAPPGFLLTPAARAPPALPARLPTMAAHGHGQLGGLQPHVLKVDVGEDIVSKIVGVSKISGKAVCVLSVLGVVQEANLLHSAVILNHKGPLEIIQVFGSILTSDSPGFGCLSVSLACADCTVVGGIVAGPLVAARPVQAIVGSFDGDVLRANKTPNIIARYPNSQVATGYRVTHYPSSQVGTSFRVTHYPNSQVGTSIRVTHYPSSQVGTNFRVTHYPSSQVASATSCTAYPSSQVAVGTGSVLCLSSEVATGSLSQHEPNSQVPIGDGSTKCSNSQVTVGDGTVGSGSTVWPSPHVPVGNKSTPSVGDGPSRHEANSHVSGGVGSTSNSSCEANVGDDDGRTDNGKSLAAVGDGITNKKDSGLGVGSTSKGNCDGTLVDGNISCVGNGSSPEYACIVPCSGIE